MFQLLEPAHYPNVQPLLASLPSALILPALLEETSPGSIWVDDPLNPTSCFVISAEGNYLAGNPNNEAFNTGLKAYIPILDEDHLVIEPDSSAWEATLKSLFDGRIVLEPRLYYEFDQFRLDWRALLPADMTMETVDADFLQRTHLKNMPAVWAGFENNWFSREDFLKYGFGRCLVHENTVVSWCLVDCVSGNRCEVGIHTDPAYRKQGYAAITVSANIEAAHQAGYTRIGWHCWEHNIGSRKVADKVGFKLMHPYPAYVCMDADNWYTMELGVMQARGGNHREALVFYEKAGDLGWAYFLAARSHLALDENETALQKLKAALDHGWNEQDYLLNDEFKPLHDLPGWQVLISDPRLQEESAAS